MTPRFYFTVVLSCSCAFGLFGLAGCVPAETIPVSEIAWSDGDSGRVDGVRFRLADVDAPEIGSSAQCDKERALGRAAKTFFESITANGDVKMVDWGEVDGYDRKVIDLLIGEDSLIDVGIANGHLQPWTHIDGSSIGPKPDWC